MQIVSFLYDEKLNSEFMHSDIVMKTKVYVNEDKMECWNVIITL